MSPHLVFFLILILPLNHNTLTQGTYDISKEPGWDNFVREASKATGGNPRDMDNFVSGVNGNLANINPNITQKANALDDSQSTKTKTVSITTFVAPAIAPTAMHNNAFHVIVDNMTKGLLIALLGHLVV
ncbi:hypothetical protein HPP92_005927 [Vanilla planifolia]|uniref:Uncharacterized protein n=1 Tax=Vanilla planifolia TaxID=51239 RepID=A0A835VF67_VANPL|nr:hypothetical protein HPP92_005927 [Vanilla planifolia]